mgnify:CR=1 FL=1
MIISFRSVVVVVGQMFKSFVLFCFFFVSSDFPGLFKSLLLLFFTFMLRDCHHFEITTKYYDDYDDDDKWQQQTWLVYADTEYRIDDNDERERDERFFSFSTLSFMI